MGRGNRADHHGGRLVALGQGIGQTVEQLTDAEVIDRDNDIGRRAGTYSGATDQAVEHACALLEHRTDGCLASGRAGQVGDDLGVCPIDTDDTVPCRT
ncbi:hypothetical protein D9M73_259650 [compost metagenome]